MCAKDMKAEIISFLNGKGIPAVGMASSAPLASVADDFQPESILRAANSVICYALPVPKGILYAENNSSSLYWRYCNMAYRHLDTVSNRLSLMLEEWGQSACPIYGCFPWKTVGREFWGLIPLVLWAEQAGIGKVTECGLVASHKYGTRILLGGVITTAMLEPDGKLTDTLCPVGCSECINACPVHAIGSTGKVDHNLCIRQSGANPLLSHLLDDSGTRSRFPFETILNTVGVDDHGLYTCSKCVEVCPLNLGS